MSPLFSGWTGDDLGYHMNIKKTIKICLTVVAIYCFIAVISFYAGGESFIHRSDNTGDILSPTSEIGELVIGREVVQPFSLNVNRIAGVDILFGTYSRENTSSIRIGIYRDNGELICEKTVSTETLPDKEVQRLYFDPAPEIQSGEKLTLRICSDDAESGNAVTLFYGSSISLRRGEIKKQYTDDERARVDDQMLDGILFYRVFGQADLLFGRIYWYIVAVGFAILIAVEYIVVHKIKTGRRSYLLYTVAVFKKYQFMIEQIVSRDFKTKYRRSVLGVLWSFLNPLLTTLVQYLVFSALFSSGIDNFALYLLVGSVCFSSIIANAGLITKVYIPKYIYPFTRVMSSTINFLMAFIPLFLVMLLTGGRFTPALWFLPMGIILLVLFCMGVGFILATSMVFFRDTQFLWGVVSMMWMYLTPIFYPISIIPEKFLPFYKMNPMYQFIRFFRTILMEGIAPSPINMLACLLMAAIALVLGLLILKKNQDRFVLYL